MQEPKGEQPWGDRGPLLLLAIFLVVWVGDTFEFHCSTFLTARVPQGIPMTLLALALLFTFLQIRTTLSALSLLSLALLVPIFLFYNCIASHEERLLAAKLGQPSYSYEARTGKWLPFASRRTRKR